MQKWNQQELRKYVTTLYVYAGQARPGQLANKISFCIQELFYYIKPQKKFPSNTTKQKPRKWIFINDMIGWKFSLKSWNNIPARYNDQLKYKIYNVFLKLYLNKINLLKPRMTSVFPY